MTPSVALKRFGRALEVHHNIRDGFLRVSTGYLWSMVLLVGSLALLQPIGLFYTSSSAYS